VRILIADAHDVIRRTVRTTLEAEPGWVVCGEATTGLEVLAKATELAPDVVVIDVDLQGLSTLELTRAIRRETPGARLVALTTHASHQLAQHLLDAGAGDFVPKADVGRSLVHVIKAVIGVPASGEGVHTIIVDTIHDDVVESAGTESGDSAAPNLLTARERQVLQLLAEGKSNKEIGAFLAISAKTVETYRARIMSKLGLRSMNHLVRYAIRHRIINA
jgi:DNA-binding NarL/FixJ family response regulator